ncbi:MAG: permease-like cell division protein FtsX [Bacteroidales bacterium]
MKKKDNNILYGRLIRSYLSSVISISLVLFLVGISGIIIVNARKVSNYFKENIVVSAVLTVESAESDADSLINVLQKKKYIKNIKYISKADGVKEMKKMLGEDFLDVFESNPIPISLDLQINADYISTDSLIYIEGELLAIPIVEDVVYQESLIDLLNTNLEKIGIVFAIFIALLLFISVVLINNTVRLNVYSKRFTIHTMRLVGATKSFIIGPFVLQAFFQGLISGLVAVLGLTAVFYLIRNEFNQLFAMLDVTLIFYVFISVILIGIIICMISTARIVRKLISLTNDELYY